MFVQVVINLLCFVNYIHLDQAKTNHNIKINKLITHITKTSLVGTKRPRFPGCFKVKYIKFQLGMFLEYVIIYVFVASLDVNVYLNDKSLDVMVYLFGASFEKNGFVN